MARVCFLDRVHALSLCLLACSGGWALRRGLEMLDDEPEDGEDTLVEQHKTSREVTGGRPRG